MKSLVYSTSLALCALLATLGAMPPMAATPAPAPTAAPAASATEQQFVTAATADLGSRFATTQQAAAAGYFQFTTEDKTGAISWVNTKNWQSDPQHPSQLWYDANGRLIGADFSVLQSNSPKAPDVWGVSASRFLDFSPGHVHFGITTPTGVQFGGIGSKTMAKVGGSVANPTKANVVAVSKLDRWKVLKIAKPKSVADVAFVFAFPAIWDLQVWLVPNPLGAFAEHNPNVVPTANAKDQD
jgi:hypothetical protein